MYKPYKLSKLKRQMKEKLNNMLYIRGASLEDLFLEQFERKNKKHTKYKEIDQIVVKGRLQASQNNYLRDKIQYKKFIDKFTNNSSGNGTVLKNILLSLQMDEDAQLEEVDLEQLSNASPQPYQKQKLTKIHRLIREYAQYKFTNKLLQQSYKKLWQRYTILQQDYHDLQLRYNDEIEYRSKIEEQYNNESAMPSVSLLHNQYERQQKGIKQLSKPVNHDYAKRYIDAVNDYKYNLNVKSLTQQDHYTLKPMSAQQHINQLNQSGNNINIQIPQNEIFTLQIREQHEFIQNFKNGKLTIADYVNKSNKQQRTQEEKYKNHIQIQQNQYNSPTSINFTFADISNVPNTIRLPPKEREQIIPNLNSKLYDYSLPGSSQMIPHICRQSLLSEINKTDQTISSPSLRFTSKMSNSRLQYITDKPENDKINQQNDEEQSSDIYNNQENDLVLEQRSNQQKTVQNIQVKEIKQDNQDLQNTSNHSDYKEQSQFSVKNTIEEMLNEQQNDPTPECQSVEHISQQPSNTIKSSQNEPINESEPLNSVDEKYQKAMALLNLEIDKIQTLNDINYDLAQNDEQSKVKNNEKAQNSSDDHSNKQDNQVISNKSDKNNGSSTEYNTSPKEQSQQSQIDVQIFDDNSSS